MTKLGYLVFCNRGRRSRLDPRELLDELAAIEVEIVEEIEALRDVLNMTTVHPEVSNGEPNQTQEHRGKGKLRRLNLSRSLPMNYCAPPSPADAMLYSGAQR